MTIHDKEYSLPKNSLEKSLNNGLLWHFTGKKKIDMKTKPQEKGVWFSVTTLWYSNVHFSKSQKAYWKASKQTDRRA